jgi:hypothetical protein
MARLFAIATAIASIGIVSAAESPRAQTISTTELDALVGQPVDIAPWTYAWRADRPVQEKPEAYFIPRRLDRIDKVYRTAYYTLSHEELRRLQMGKPPAPPPKGRLKADLLWTGKLSDYQVELHWPVSVDEIPLPEAVEVRVYPSRFWWFGFTEDQGLYIPKVSPDRRTWTYKGGGPTEMVAVFCEQGKTPRGITSAVPTIRVTSPHMGTWERVDVEIEWGFEKGKENASFDRPTRDFDVQGQPLSPLTGDTGTKATAADTFQSRASGNSRHGIVVPLVYTRTRPPALDSRVTVWTGETTGFTFRVNDLDNGPILMPEHGVCVTRASSGKTARQFVEQLAAKNLKTIPEMARERPESTSWDEVMQNVRFWTCPEETPVPPFPKVDAPAMEVEVPDARWTDAWRGASHQLRGAHLYLWCAVEVGRVAHDMDLVGLHEEADRVYQYYLKTTGAKPDGDYLDGKGALGHDDGMRHDIGFGPDVTHASTGQLLFAMADRYFLTGDKDWFLRHRARMQEAADWIIRQRKLYLWDVPNREDLLVAGMMPPYMLGEVVLPSCDWQFHHCGNLFALNAIQRFADLMAEFDEAEGRRYRAEADAFRRDLRRHLKFEATLGPVRPGRDGRYHTYISRMGYMKGQTSPELGLYHYNGCDLFEAPPCADLSNRLRSRGTRPARGRHDERHREHPERLPSNCKGRPRRAAREGSPRTMPGSGIRISVFPRSR